MKKDKEYIDLVSSLVKHGYVDTRKGTGRTLKLKV